MIDVLYTVVFWFLVVLAVLSLSMAVVHAFMGEWNGAVSWLVVAVFMSVVALLVYVDYKDSVKTSVINSVNINEGTCGKWTY